MGITLKKVVIDNKTMTVISEEEGLRLYDSNALFDDLCIENGDFVYPITKRYMPGIPSAIISNAVVVYNSPSTVEEKEKFSVSRVIDFGSNNIKDFRDHIRKIDELKSEQTIGRMGSIDNALTLVSTLEDAPELRLIKEAVSLKKIDADSYKDKFPSNSDFNNDMRALKSMSNHKISFFKAKRILNSFDIEAELILRDKEDAQNPMGKELRVILTEDE